MAYLVSHSNGSLVVQTKERAMDIAMRLKHTGAEDVSVTQLTEEEHRAEKASRLPPHLRHLAGT